MAAYTSPTDAESGLTAAFSPSTPQQTAAIKTAAALVPTTGAPADGSAPKTDSSGSTGGSTGNPAPQPTGSDSAYYSRISGNPDTTVIAPSPQSVEEIQAEKSKAAQAEINSLNSYYADLSAEQGVINAKNDRSTAAISTLSGLAGSTEANVAQQETTSKNQQATAKIQHEQEVAIQGILSKIRSDAVTEARQQRLDYNQSVTDSIANRAALQKEAADHVTNLTAAGVTADGLKTSDPTSYAHLLKQYGGDEAALKGAFVLNTPKDQILGTSVVGGSMVISRKNPITGKVTVESVDLGLPKGTVQVADAGGYILFGKAGADGKWDGDMGTTTKINKTLSPADAAKNGTGNGGSTDLSSLPAAAQATLKTNGFTGYNTSTQTLASDLVDGRMAPADLSKRTTGSSSYNDVLTAADKYALATTGKHFDISKANRDYKFATNISTQNTLNYLGSLVGSDNGSGITAGGNLDALINLSKSVAEPKGLLGFGQTTFPALNQADQWAKLQSGDPQIAGYYTTMLEVSDQIAKVLQGGGTGSGTSDAKLAQAQGLFQKGFTKEQVAEVAGSLKTLLANRATSMIKDNPYLSDYATQFGVKQGAAPSSGGGNIVTAPDGTQIQITD